MARTLSVIALVGLLIAAPAAAQQRAPRLDPLLRDLTRPEVRRMIEAAPRLGVNEEPGEQPFAGMLDLDRDGPGGSPRIAVFVKVSDNGTLARLRAAGASLGALAGDIVTARIPLDALERAAAVRGVLAMQASRRVEVKLDVSRHTVRADRIQSMIGDTWTGTAGQGVIVGVYDTGLDFRHDDFKGPEGGTRLLGLWDQTLSGTPPAGFDFGTYCDADLIDSGGCGERDRNGHGTHVAGIAAGDGSAGSTPYRYVGIAPAADIIAVKGGDAGFGNADIVDGVSWIFQRATALGRPAVVNLSLGSDYGPHDGTQLYEQALTNLTGPGRLIVSSAGNGGSNGTEVPQLPPYRIHGMHLPQVGVSQDFTFRVPDGWSPSSGTCNDLAYVDMWYEAGDSMRVEVFRPDGTNFSVVYGQDQWDDASNGQIRIDHASVGADPENGDNEVIIRVGDCDVSGPPAPGLWVIRVTPTVFTSGQYYHLWMFFSSFGSNGYANGETGFDNGYLVGSPAAADGIIAVGAFATKLQWQIEDGSTVAYNEQEPVGELARFSAGGPRRDGVLKPEITAPGIGIASALSGSAGNVGVRKVADGAHWILEGTSMAAPHVTGGLALLLQSDPTLTPADVRDILSRTALQDAFTSGTYGNAPGTDATSWWGYGKLDVEAAVADLVDLNAVTAVLLLPASDTVPSASTVQLQGWALTAKGDSTSAGLTWVSSDPSVATVDPDGLMTTLMAGITTITVSGGGSVDSAFIQVVDPATLVVTADGIAPPETLSSRAGTTIPLVELGLRVNGFEAIRVDQLGFDVLGADPGAHLVLVNDAGRNGVVDASDPVIADTAVSLVADDTATVLVQLDGFSVPEQDSVTVLATVRLSGSAPNGASFRLTFRPADTRSVGTVSGVQDRRSDPADVVISPVASTTLLETGEAFALSENPVRSTAGEVIFNFDPNQPPNLAAVYTLDGRRVVDLMPLIEGGTRAVWRLRNDGGGIIAPGIYILVVRFEDRTIREKLIVARSATASGGE